MTAYVKTWEPRPYKAYQWIVKDDELLHGVLAIRGTRLSVSLILECLSSGMTVSDINESFGGLFPTEALLEVFAVASEITARSEVC